MMTEVGYSINHTCIFLCLCSALRSFSWESWQLVWKQRKSSPVRVASTTFFFQIKTYQNVVTNKWTDHWIYWENHSLGCEYKGNWWVFCTMPSTSGSGCFPKGLCLLSDCWVNLLEPISKLDCCQLCFWLSFGHSFCSKQQHWCKHTTQDLLRVCASLCLKGCSC